MWAGIFPTEDVSVLKHLNMYISFAKLFGAKVCLYGIDIDSLDTTEYRSQWKRIFKSVDFIETRNATCAKQLKNIVGDSDLIISGVDITHAFYTEEEVHQINLLRNYNLKQPYIIWAVAMPWSAEELQRTDIKQRYEKLCDQFRNLLESKNDAHHVFPPFFAGTDITMINDIVQGTNVDYTVINQECPIGEKRLFFKYAVEAVVMLFHGVQFALFYGTPFVAVSYSPKTTNVLKEFGLNGMYVEYGIRENSCFKKEFDISEKKWKKLINNMGSQKEAVESVS